MTHQPGQGHQDWLERKRRNKRNREASRNGGPAQTSSNSGPAPSLVLNDQMRQALLTHHGFDEIQMQAVEDAARQGN